MSKKKIFNSKHAQLKDNYNQLIIDLMLKNPKKPLNYKQVAGGLKLTKRPEIDRILKQLQQLASKKEVVEVTPGKFLLNKIIEFVTGKIDVTQSGAAYVIVEGQEQDIYIQKSHVKNCFNGDIVKVQMLSGKKKPEGKVIGIIERKKTEFVGQFQLAANKKYGFVVPDSNAITVDFFIPMSKINNAQDGEKVIVKMTDWPDDADSPFGEIIEVLGQPGDNETEMHAILAEYGLPYKFPEEVEQEANAIDTRILPEEIAKRRDMRHITTFTIDPKDAKDFDDALSIQKLENGNWEIGVHIADVAHYVQPNTLLDEEAYKRATSVYLVDRVVPMLPEVLSNNVCSLRPNEEKYTFSGVFELDDDSNVKNTWFGRTVIYSDKRFAYEDAQEIIEGKDGDLKEEILTLDRLAKNLREQRLKKGAIAFDKVEIKFNLDESNEPLGVYFKQSKDANHLIEEFMLLANKKVSEFVSLTKNKPNGHTYIYRIHDDPNPEKLVAFKQFVKTFGYNISVNNRNEISKSLNKLLAEVKGKGEENMVETLAMRCMSKAKYSTENIGHYGLAFDYYSHFTSPIRRYPDVIAHRLLQHYLDGGKSPNAESYEENAKHCSDRERLAADAERDSIKYMQVKFMEKYVGEVFAGIISGVTEFGIYVETKMTQAEGLIRLRNLTDDHYVFDQKTYSVIGQRTKHTYQLGDDVNIKVVKANLERKQLDFEIVE